jgi:hypothetical protein
VQIEMEYGDRAGAESERVVHPLGLVAKGHVWYLVGNTDAGMRTFRVGRVRSVRLTDRPLLRPDGFDLEATWQSTLATLDEMRAPFTAVVRADPGIVPVLRSVFGTMLTAGEASDDGRVEVEIRDRTAFMIAVRLAGFGNKVEVVGPDSVRSELARIGASSRISTPELSIGAAAFVVSAGGAVGRPAREDEQDGQSRCALRDPFRRPRQDAGVLRRPVRLDVLRGRDPGLQLRRDRRADDPGWDRTGARWQPSW